MKNWRKKIEKIPDCFGVYLFYEKGRLSYVGKATSLKNRIKSYLKPKTGRPIELMIEKIDKVKWQKTDSALEAIILEANYIKKLKPKYNIKEKDDKSWNFLVITKDKFSKLKAVREKDLNFKDYKYVFGPYIGGKISEVLKILHSLFNISRCEPGQKRPCFDYQLKNCLGVCTKETDNKTYNKKVIKPLILFLKGKKKTLIRSLEKEMKNHSLNQKFEEARRIRDQIFSLKRIIDFSLLDKSFLENQSKNISPIKRIEGYDISNLGNEAMVGSMVVFQDGKPQRGEYKRFKIKARKTQSDVDCLKEVLERRMRHKEWPLPNLILVDGGLAQVNAAKKVLKKDIPVIGIAKGKERKRNELISDKKNNKWVSENKGLLIKVRDEAHRFAINYQRQLKRKLLIKNK